MRRVFAGLFIYCLACCAAAEGEFLISPYPQAQLDNSYYFNYVRLPLMIGGNREIRSGGYQIQSYLLPEGISEPSIYEGMDAALKEKGFSSIYSCDQHECMAMLAKEIWDTFRYEGYSTVRITNFTDQLHFTTYHGKLAEQSVFVNVYSHFYHKQARYAVEVLLEKSLPLISLNISPDAAINRPLVADLKPMKEDAEGASDPAVISRLPSAYILEQSVAEYDRYPVALGPNKDAKGIPPIEWVEGRITTTNYRLHPEFTTLLAFRNYEAALKKAGFDILFSCQAKNCGPYFSRQLVVGNVLQDFHEMDVYNIKETSDYWFLSAKLERENKLPTYISVSINRYSPKYPTEIALDVVEVSKMADNLVLVDKNYIAEQLKREGRISLYNIEFDFDSAKIKPESQATLDAITQFLLENTKISLYVVGHTDNKGNYQHNLSLSSARAEAVVSALIKDKKIAAERLLPAGVGPLSPRAVNDSENNMYQNRRVELVLKDPLYLP